MMKLLFGHFIFPGRSLFERKSLQKKGFAPQEERSGHLLCRKPAGKTDLCQTTTRHNYHYKLELYPRVESRCKQRQQDGSSKQVALSDRVSGKLLHTGGRWGAIDSLCEALFVNFFEELFSSVSRGAKTPAALRSPASASEHFSELFCSIFQKIKILTFSSFLS
jgi:hypothetical protein